MKRRTFIVAATGVVAALGASWQAFRLNDEDVIAMVVRRRLDYLKLDDAGVQRFAHDMQQRQVISRTRLRLLSVIAPVYSHYALSSGTNKFAHTLRHGEDRIVSTYLICSDFFLNGANEAVTVNYLGMLDPIRACSNPFAQLVT